MANRVLATIISLRDQFTRPAQNIANSTNGINREIQRTTDQIRRFGKNIAQTAVNAVKNTAKIAGAFASMAAGFAIKTGFGEAMNLEGFKTQLETATKSAKKAGEVMAYSVKLANSTPFETGAMVEAAAKLEAMGLSSRNMLVNIADMAGATNKGIDQATEAIIDAQAGELERMKEFGITKQMIIDQANKTMKGKQIVNNKGQITDQENFNKALFSLMESKFKGGADKQSKTFNGMLSTVTGITKTALANIVGMQEGSTIRQGSLYELLKGKIQVVADTLLKWQSDGTIQRIASQVTQSVMKMIEIIKGIITGISEVYNFFKNNWSTIAPVIMTVITAMTAYKAIMIAQIIYTKAFAAAEFIKNNVVLQGTIGMRAMAIAQWAINAAMTANPIGLIITAVTLLVAGFIIAYKNSETFRNFIQGLWEMFKKLGSFIVSIPSMVVGIWDGLILKTKEIWNSINSNPFGKLALDILSLMNPITAIIRHFDKLKEGWNWIKDKVGLGEDSKTTTTTKNIGGMKMYAKGGIATKASIFGEAGPEIAIPLNSSQRSKDLLSQANNIINGNQGINLNNLNKNLGKGTATNPVSQNNTSKTVVKNQSITNNTKSESAKNPLQIIFQGDVYGFEDFKEKAAKAIFEVINVNGANIAGVR